MANRYLVGTGNRNWNDPSSWSDSSGGSSSPTTGSDKITVSDNRDFTSDTGWWTKFSGCTISGGTANHNGSGGTYYVFIRSGTLSISSNTWYKLTFTVKNYTSGKLLIRCIGNYSIELTPVNNTTYSFYFQQANSETTVDFRSGAVAFTGSIDDVSIMEVISYIPTSSDNAILDNNSGTGTITVNAIANMADFNCSGLKSTITLANSAYAFNIYGNFTLCSNTYLNTSFTGTGYVYLKATTSVNITSNGCTRAWNRIYLDGVGGTWTNQDDWSASTGIYLTNGTWYTNDKTITCGLLGGSAIVEQKCFMYCGSSTLNITSLLNTRYGGKIYPQTSIAYTSGGQYENYDWNIVYQTVSGNSQTYIPQKVNYLYIIGAANIAQLMLYGNGTVYYDLSITGNNSTTQRLLIHSSSIGTARTITCNGTITASNVDFRDIVGAGTANWDLSNIAGGSGDCGGNSGITFTTAQPQYYKHTSGACNWSDSTKWFSDQAKTIAGRVPLPQDDATFDANSFSGTSTLSVNCTCICKSLDMSGVNQAVTFSLANNIEVHGNYVLGSNITQSGNYGLSMNGRGTIFSLNTYGKTLYKLTVNVGDVIVNSNLVITGDLLADYNGSIDFNGYNCSSLNLQAKSAVHPTRTTLYLRTGIFTITQGGSGRGFYGDQYVQYGSATLLFSPLSGSGNVTFATNSNSAIINKVQFSGSHTGNFDIISSSTINELIISPGRKIRLTAGTTQTISKISIGTGATIGSITNAAHTLNYTGTEVVEGENLIVKDSTATPTSKFFAGADSVDNGNNTGWIFGDYFTPQELLIE